jgi:FkbM family methyltransferase
MTAAPDYAALLAMWHSSRGRRPALLEDRKGVVLVGAGAVGRQFHLALTRSAIPVLTFADNSPSKWGTSLLGTSVISVEEAVRQCGGSALYLITIGRIGTGVAALREQLARLGVADALHFIDAIPRLPAVWREFFLDPDAFAEEGADRCAAAFRLFRDDTSRALFASHLRWRMTLDPSELPVPSYDNQYFVDGVVSPEQCRAFVDVGAYTGDSLEALAAFAGPALRTYHGYEPDALNFERLAAVARTIGADRPDVQLTIDQLAVGAQEGVLWFSNDGAATSHVGSGESAAQVRCAALDELGVGHPSYVKIDVEGAEDAVLRGAERTLRAAKPTIAIASYHRPADLFDLPLRLTMYAEDYRFFLRSHGDAGVDLVCYAVRP